MSDCCSIGEKSAAARVMACPANGARSKQVDMLTVRSLVRQLPLSMPATQYYLCESRDCDVVYFAQDPQAPIFRRDDLLVRVGAKEESDPIPVCYCFGFTRKDIENRDRRNRPFNCDRAYFSGSEAGQLRVRSEESLGQMLSRRCHAHRSRP